MLATHRTLHRADDVTAFAHRAQRLLGIGMDGPDAWALFDGQAHALQTLQATHHQHALLLHLRVVSWLIDKIQTVPRFALQGAIQAGPTLLIDFAGQRALDLQLCARPQPFGGQLRGTLAHAPGDVGLRDDEVLARVVLASQNDVRVRVVGVLVVHCDPVQPCAQVRFHAAHQMSGVGAQVI